MILPSVTFLGLIILSALYAILTTAFGFYPFPFMYRLGFNPQPEEKEVDEDEDI